MNAALIDEVVFNHLRNELILYKTPEVKMGCTVWLKTYALPGLTPGKFYPENQLPILDFLGK
jgi:hypothetical protein